MTEGWKYHVLKSLFLHGRNMAAMCPEAVQASTAMECHMDTVTPPLFAKIIKARFT